MFSRTFYYEETLKRLESNQWSGYVCTLYVYTVCTVYRNIDKYIRGHTNHIQWVLQTIYFCPNPISQLPKNIKNILNICQCVFFNFHISFSFAQEWMVALLGQPLYGNFNSSDIKQRPWQSLMPKIALVKVPTHTIINHKIVQVPWFQ